MKKSILIILFIGCAGVSTCVLGVALPPAPPGGLSTDGSRSSGSSDAVIPRGGISPTERDMARQQIRNSSGSSDPVMSSGSGGASSRESRREERRRQAEERRKEERKDQRRDDLIRTGIGIFGNLIRSQDQNSGHDRYDDYDDGYYDDRYDRRDRGRRSGGFFDRVFGWD